MIEVKIRIDMPLPIPRSVISSPSHMMTAVPEVMVTTIVAMTQIDSFGMMSELQDWNSRPGVRATAIRPVDCRTASPTVRYRVYWVSRAVPDCPSCLRASKRGITTVSSCTMMLAVMYGMIPSAKIDSWSSAPPLNRLIRP